jgi:hypothetical protein
MTLMPKEFKSLIDLSFNTKYEVKFMLKNKVSDEVVGETLIRGNNDSDKDPKTRTWTDFKYIAIPNSDEDVVLVYKV